MNEQIRADFEHVIERIKMIKDFVDPVRGSAVHHRVEEVVETLESMSAAHARYAGSGAVAVAVAEVVSKYGDPEAFGEREIKLLTDIQKLPYRTKLYTSPAPAVPEGLDFDLIAAVLEDYCFLQTSGIIAAANRYATSDVNEQIDLLTQATKESDK